MKLRTSVKPPVKAYKSYAIIPGPIWCIPRTRAAYDAMVRQIMAGPIAATPIPYRQERRPHELRSAKRALAAIGITRP